MKTKILIVEDEFIEANNLQMILERAGYTVTNIAESFDEALDCVNKDTPDLVLLDIYLRGPRTGIDLAKILRERNIAFVYLSANSNRNTFSAAKMTQPYGFLVKPFREKDVLVTLEIARYVHEQRQELWLRKANAEPLASQKTGDFSSIIGNSTGLMGVLNHIKLVANTETTVLILGESGTGKERIMDCIHEHSLRKGKPLIKVNCSALPASLIESELFGHEKGAFTGATDRRLGKFEQADKGTIFLDEIGDMPMDLQVKLLRVLQEKEIERVGGKETIKIDVRIIAATNHNLEKEVSDGRFRIDLYYRLNVFPIIVPPLRERKEDIPLLAEHFIKLFAKRNGKKIDNISENALKKLISYSWPGNIRELEHLMERTVLLSENNIVDEVTLPVSAEAFVVQNDRRVKTIEEVEIDHIKSVLHMCNGKIAGPGGAAELLGLPYSTLVSKIKKLGIKKDVSFD